LIGDLDAYDSVLCAHALENEYTEESLAEAIRCSKQAMALDPSYAPAMAMAALCCAERRQQGLSTNPEEDTDEGLRHAIRALEISQYDPKVLWMGSFAVRFLVQIHTVDGSLLLVRLSSIRIRPWLWRTLGGRS